jgi:hypothetical protein
MIWLRKGSSKRVLPCVVAAVAADVAEAPVDLLMPRAALQAEEEEESQIFSTI